MLSIVSAKPLWLAGLQGDAAKQWRRVSRLRRLARSSLAKMWRECPQEMNKPELPSWQMPLLVVISHPTVKSALMCGRIPFRNACPGLAKLVLAVCLQQAGEQLLKTVLTRLRQHNCPLLPLIWLLLICMRWHWQVARPYTTSTH